MDFKINSIRTIHSRKVIIEQYILTGVRNACPFLFDICGVNKLVSSCEYYVLKWFIMWKITGMKSTSGINHEKLGQKAGLGLKDVLQRLNVEILVLDRVLYYCLLLS